MKTGKVTCRILKEIRQQIASANDIQFVTSKCRHKGDCLGTCPKCEAEIRYLEQQLLSRQKAGLNVKVVGVSLGLSTLFSGSLYGQEVVEDSIYVLPEIEVVGNGVIKHKSIVAGGILPVAVKDSIGKLAVKGLVVNKCGCPLIGARVTEKGRDNSTVTDDEGHFLLWVRRKRAVLEVSSKGMKTKKIRVRKRKATKMKVVLRVNKCKD